MSSYSLTLMVLAHLQEEIKVRAGVGMIAMTGDRTAAQVHHAWGGGTMIQGTVAWGVVVVMW